MLEVYSNITLIKLQENLLILVRLDLELKIEPLLLYIPGVLQTPRPPFCDYVMYVQTLRGL